MDAEIKGTTMPVLEVTLQQGEQVVSTRGELSWMTPNIQLSQHMSTGSGRGGLMQGIKRVMGGGGLFLTRYEAVSGAGMITFAAKLPGHIVPVDIAPGQAFYVHHHGWLCGTPGLTASIGLQQTFRGGLWGGDGFILQKLDGQGRAWIELSGELVHYTLAPGQTLMVHPGHVGMFEGSVQFADHPRAGHHERGLRRRRLPPGRADRPRPDLAAVDAAASARPRARPLPGPPG